MACQRNKYDQALNLMRESVASAQLIPNFTRDTLLSLHCKYAEIMLMSGRNKEALALAQDNLKAINFNDWREQLVAYRLLEVERLVLLHQDQFDKARVVAEKMNDLDDIEFPNTLEAAKRRVRTVEIDFVKKDYKKVISEVEASRVLDAIGFDKDPNLYLIMVYTGISLMATGKTEEGRQLLISATAQGEKYGAPYFGEWAEKTMDSLSFSAEIHKLLKR